MNPQLIGLVLQIHRFLDSITIYTSVFESLIFFITLLLINTVMYKLGEASGYQRAKEETKK